MDKRIVVFTGFAGSGKTRAAKLLVEEGNFRHMKMARMLKDILVEVGMEEDYLEDRDKKEAVLARVPFRNNTPQAVAHDILAALTARWGWTEYGLLARLKTEPLQPVPQAQGKTMDELVEAAENVVTGWLWGLGGTTTPRRIMQELGTDFMRWVHPDIHVNYALTELQGESSHNIVFDDVRFPNEIEALRKLGAYVVWLHRPALVPKDRHASEHSIGDGCADIVVKSLEGEALDEAVRHWLYTGSWPNELIMREKNVA
jgi:hypothetical protein